MFRGTTSIGKRASAMGMALASVMLCAFNEPAAITVPDLSALDVTLAYDETFADLAGDDLVFGGEGEAATPARDYFASGRASFYADKFHGRRTANGEIFRQTDYTAAHRTLPMGTRVKVTCANSGRSVTVRVNDRGPFVGNRVIDLSKAAARELGMLNAGLAEVTLELLPTI